MTVLAGLQAAVKKDAAVESTVAGWKIRDRGLPAFYAASNTSGGQSSTAGNQDWNGWCRGYGHTPLLFPGDLFTFLGSIDATNGVSGSAICDRLTITAPAEQGEDIIQRAEFSSNGALSYGAAVAVDTSNVTALNAAGLKLSVDGADADEVRFWRLMFGARNKRYAASGVPGVIRRRPGVFFAQALYQVYTDDPTSVPTRGDTALMRFYVTTTTYWELAWMRFDLIDEFGAEIEGQELVGYTAAMSFAAHLGTSLGHVKNPAGNTKWP